MAERLNVLFLMTDQHRTDTLGCYGNAVVHTPNLDRIAGSGTCFDQFYTPTAICTPARASLFTGVHPFRHGLFVNPERAGGAQAEVPEHLTVLSEPLRRAGYRMGHAGKWHIGRDRGPEFYGIDGEHLPGALNPFTHPSYEKWLADNDLPRFAVEEPIYGVAENGSGRGHLIAGRLQQPFEATMERFITEQALELLRGYAEGGTDANPFWLTCSWFGPHLPYLIPDEYFDMYDPDLVELPRSMAETFDGKPPVQRHYSEYWSADGFDADQWRKLIAVYWGYVTMIDDCVGLLLEELEKLGVYDKTAIMFTADHGEFTGAHRLNDKGPAMYDDIYRIPGVFRVPGQNAQRRDEFASLVDVAPTILELAGAEPVEGHDGRSLVPLLAGDRIDPPWREQIVAEFHGHHFPHSQRMLRDNRYKLVYNPESVNELYDLELDPYELHNLHSAPSYRKVRDDLELRLYRELVERGDPAHTWMTYMTNVGDERAPDVDGVADAVAPDEGDPRAS